MAYDRWEKGGGNEPSLLRWYLLSEDRFLFIVATTFVDYGYQAFIENFYSMERRRYNHLDSCNPQGDAVVMMPAAELLGG